MAAALLVASGGFRPQVELGAIGLDLAPGRKDAEPHQRSNNSFFTVRTPSPCRVEPNRDGRPAEDPCSLARPTVSSAGPAESRPTSGCRIPGHFRPHGTQGTGRTTGRTSDHGSPRAPCPGRTPGPPAAPRRSTGPGCRWAVEQEQCRPRQLQQQNLQACLLAPGQGAKRLSRAELDFVTGKGGHRLVAQKRVLGHEDLFRPAARQIGAGVGRGEQAGMTGARRPAPGAACPPRHSRRKDDSPEPLALSTATRSAYQISTQNGRISPANSRFSHCHPFAGAAAA